MTRADLLVYATNWHSVKGVVGNVSIITMPYDEFSGLLINVYEKGKQEGRQQLPPGVSQDAINYRRIRDLRAVDLSLNQIMSYDFNGMQLLQGEALDKVLAEVSG